MTRLEIVERAAKAKARTTARTADGREALARKAWGVWRAAPRDDGGFSSWLFMGEIPEEPPQYLLRAARDGELHDLTPTGVARAALALLLESSKTPIRTDAAGHLLPD